MTDNRTANIKYFIYPTFGYFCEENVNISFLFKRGLKLNYSSKLLENAVNELARLPGIGKKTALRLALHLIRQDVQQVESFSGAILKMRNEIKGVPSAIIFPTLKFAISARTTSATIHSFVLSRI
jgi:stage III sporulation protein SpoIIIAA